MDYVIFSIDKWNDLHTMAKFTRHMDTLRAMDKLKGNVVSLIGGYKGKMEASFIVSRKDFEDHVRPSGYVDNQESFLYVSNSKRCYLRYNDGYIEEIGICKEVSKDVAMSDHEGFTYHPISETYWVVE